MADGIGIVKELVQKHGHDDGKDKDIDRVRAWKLKELETKAIKDKEKQELVRYS